MHSSYKKPDDKSGFSFRESLAATFTQFRRQVAGVNRVVAIAVPKPLLWTICESKYFTENVHIFYF